VSIGVPIGCLVIGALLDSYLALSFFVSMGIDQIGNLMLLLKKLFIIVWEG
jgi:hypothetical protein